MSDMIEIPRIVLDDWLRVMSGYQSSDHDGEGYNNDEVIDVVQQLEHILTRHDAKESK